jgi:CRISPR-associated protein Cas5h
MEILSFRWRSRFGHFLRAEANVNALSYPMPPRTAVLGLLAAILGLEKDTLAEELDDARIAIAGAPPKRFWHRVKLRKDLPATLPAKVRAIQKGTKNSKPEKAALVRQEWLFNPDFLIYCALPEQPERFSELVERVQDRRWHFGPCMGLSELLADIEFVDLTRAESLPAGEYRVDTLCPAGQVELRAGDGLGVHLLRMPHSVDAERVFRHAPVYLEHRGKSIPAHTDSAWRVGERTLCFL